MDASHVGECRKCAPDAFPAASLSEQRQGRYHVSKRFTTVPSAIFISVYVDGVKTARAVEAMGSANGQPGWVVEYVGVHRMDLGYYRLNMHDCPAAGIMQPCEVVRYGDVLLDVEWTESILAVVDQIDPALLVGDVPPDIAV